jgi:hypothetical protein
LNRSFVIGGGGDHPDMRRYNIIIGAGQGVWREAIR